MKGSPGFEVLIKRWSLLNSVDRINCSVHSGSAPVNLGGALRTVLCDVAEEGCDDPTCAPRSWRPFRWYVLSADTELVDLVYNENI